MSSSSESDSIDVPEENEEGEIYQLIYNMNTQEEKELESSSSSGNTPVHVKIDPERMPRAVVANKKGLDMNVLDNIQEIPAVKANAEEKPWRKAGADISDYFNYGFDEESWNTYCIKQAIVRSTKRKLSTKLTGQKGCSRHEGKKKCPATSSGSPSVLASSRQLNAATEERGGQPGCSGRVEARRCLRDEGNNSQVATEMAHEEDKLTSDHLSSPANFSYPFAYTPPPPFLYRSGPPPPYSFATLDSLDSKSFDGPSTSRRPRSSDVPCLIPRYMASKAGVINTAKSWECFIWEEKCETNREKSREQVRYKDSHRGRARESCFSSHSEEERMRHRDTVERGHKRTSDRFSGEKEERNSRKRHRDNEEGWQKPSSSKSMGDGGEDKAGQSRRKNKKKRNRKDKETDKMFSADQERKLKSD
ncbi:pre-mRNA 3'-end-processing factor FIP1 isoform X2 [Centropristis striata]|uniref:pre-mRNA 3'-end-processing factor FIP1 isoform X2 n=1 Tax=Centropristis striata TaxID=184440 RepID=UPI0027DF0375|nr:pre-mRNA 3'-end-processing factor FIP1 isoform X2 [Centropristis striata]